MTTFYIIMALMTLLNLGMLIKAYSYMKRSWKCTCDFSRKPKLEFYKDGIVIKNKKGKDVIRAEKPLQQ